MSRGRPVPTLVGVVVSNGNRAMLMDAFNTWAYNELEKKSAANELRVVKAWEKITRLVLLRQHVHDKYGGGNRETAAASSSLGKKAHKVKHTKPAY